MKHLKLFESTRSYTFTRVDFTGGGDGVYALYIDGNLYKYGDFYHDKIEIWIESFIEGIRWCGITINYKMVKCANPNVIERISELADTPPNNLEDIDNETY